MTKRVVDGWNLNVDREEDIRDVKGSDGVEPCLKLIAIQSHTISDGDNDMKIDWKIPVSISSRNYRSDSWRVDGWIVELGEDMLSGSVSDKGGEDCWHWANNDTRYRIFRKLRNM